MINISIIDQDLFDQRPRLSEEDKKMWIEALKSGTYQKGKHRLNHNNEYCCLGVLCELEGLKKVQYNDTFYYGEDGCLSVLPSDSKYFNLLLRSGEFKGFKINNCGSLAQLNDCTQTFSSIIKVIKMYF